MAFVVIACGGGTQSQPEGGTPAATPAPPPAPIGASTISGTVRLEGKPPEARVIKMSSDPLCMPEGPTVSEVVLVGPGNGLQNVFVYIKDGLGDRTFTAPSTPVELTQKGCKYMPHVFGAQVGQPVKIVNSDPTLHNVHAVPKDNTEFNFGQPLKGMETTRMFDKPEVMVLFKCDVHGWMVAHGGIVAHPFFAVTKSDGSFEIKGLPAGTFTIETWHEQYGLQTQTVTVDGTAAGKADFAYKAS
jgi:plastocyanin